MSEGMAQRIKELRKEKGLTLEQVADIVGVGKSTVRKWETGMIANMKRDKIYALAEALHTTPAYLMGWEENSNTNIAVNNGIIGNHNSHNVVGLDANGEIEKEILNICKKLDIKRKNALLTRAYELLDKNE